MNKSLTKSSNKVIAGVCGGLAEYFGMDYTVTRSSMLCLLFLQPLQEELFTSSCGL